MEELISNFGYWAVLIGTFLEGETIVLLAAFAAHRGYLQLGWVIAAAFTGSLAGDQLHFFLARRYGRAFIDKRPKLKKRIARAEALLSKHSTWFILGFRFLYGLRTVSSFAVGLSGVGRLKFLLLNALGASTWAVLLSLLGYFVGEVMQRVLGRLERYELWIFAAIALGGSTIALVHRLRAPQDRPT